MQSTNKIASGPSELCQDFLDMTSLPSKSPDDVEAALKLDPEAVTKKGWNSQILLHKAVLSCHLDVVKLLLKYNSDPNCPDNSGRTSVHYACLSSRLDVLAELIQYGGDVTHVDNTGQTCVHLAAIAGSVLVLHYLHVVHNQPLNIQDNNSISPVHLACNHGHLMVFRFLLRHDRCRVDTIDAWGNSALHLAAANGSDALCWEIVSHSIEGAKLLSVKDMHNKTPADVARVGTLIRFQELCKWLDKWKVYTESTNRPPPPPNFLWLVSLFSTPLWYLATLLICRLMPYSSLIAFIALFMLARGILQKSHRLHHPARFQEPAFTGLFVSGFLFTLLCYAFHIQAYRYCDFVMNVITTSNVAIFLLLLSIILFGDPGIVSTVGQSRRNVKYNYTLRDISMGHLPITFIEKLFESLKIGHSKLSSNKSSIPCVEHSIADVALGYITSSSFCDSCEIVKPLKVRHCKLCDNCLWMMDHHCLFLMKCIAGLNLRPFILLLISVLVGNVTFLHSTYNYGIYEFNGSFAAALVNFWYYDAWTMSISIGNILCIFWTCNTLFYMLYVISSGTTTAYKIKNKYMPQKFVPYSERFYNLIYFFNHGFIRLRDDVLESLRIV